MIKQFDKSNLKDLRKDLEAALASVAKKHGIAITFKNINFYAPDFITAKTTLEMTALGDSSAASDPRAAALVKAQADFKAYASSFGLTPEQYGVTFKHGRDTYKLVGFKPRSPRFPILATNVANGTTYKLPESAIASLQTKEHKELFGIKTPTVSGMCSNDSAYDDNWKNIGKCNRPATTNRKDFNNRMQPYCEKCAQLIDESRAEMRAEARMS
jgi:hypothetical protein